MHSAAAALTCTCADWCSMLHATCYVLCALYKRALDNNHGDVPLILGTAVHPSVPLRCVAGPRETIVTWTSIEDVGPYPWRQEEAGRTRSNTLQVRPHPLCPMFVLLNLCVLTLSLSLCSAGCGRTGTIIGIDLGRTMLENKVCDARVPLCIDR